MLPTEKGNGYRVKTKSQLTYYCQILWYPSQGAHNNVELQLDSPVVECTRLSKAI